MAFNRQPPGNYPQNTGSTFPPSNSNQPPSNTNYGPPNGQYNSAPPSNFNNTNLPPTLSVPSNNQPITGFYPVQQNNPPSYGAPAQSGSSSTFVGPPSSFGSHPVNQSSSQSSGQQSSGPNQSIQQRAPVQFFNIAGGNPSPVIANPPTGGAPWSGENQTNSGMPAPPTSGFNVAPPPTLGAPTSNIFGSNQNFQSVPPQGPETPGGFGGGYAPGFHQSNPPAVAGFDSNPNLSNLAPDQMGQMNALSANPLPLLSEIDLSLQCDKKFMRATVGKIINSQAVANNSKVPLGIVIRPMAGDKGVTNDTIPIIDFGSIGIVRCKRCRTYINPFVVWIDNGRKWR